MRPGKAIGALALLACPALAACDSGGIDAPGAPTAGEERALEQAAEMLDDPRVEQQATEAESAEESDRADAAH